MEKALIKFWERNFVSKRESCLSRQINGRALNNVCIATVRVIAVVAGGGELRSPRVAESEGRKTRRQNEYLKKKKIICTQQILIYWDEYNEIQ